MRLHFKQDNLPSLEGIQRTWRTDWHGGHYVLELPKMVEAQGTSTLEGDRVRVPRENVAWIQELK